MHQDGLLWLDSVRERDIDLLLLEELTVNSDFAEWLVGEVLGNKSDFTQSVSATRSVVDARYGETDIQFVFRGSSGAHTAVLIENKIDAPPQPDQAERYILRGQSGIVDGQWSDFCTCLCSPERYFSNPTYADGYQALVSYESIRDWFATREPADTRFAYKARLVHEAIEQNRRGYTALIDDRATAFWNAYWEMVNRTHPELELRHPGKRPAGSTWIQFRPKVLPAGWVLQHKAERGIVDLELRGMAGALTDFQESTAGSLPEEITLVRASKSLAFRQRVRELDHFEPFENQREVAEDAIRTVAQMLRFASNLKLVHPKSG